MCCAAVLQEDLIGLLSIIQEKRYSALESESETDVEVPAGTERSSVDDGAMRDGPEEPSSKAPSPKACAKMNQFSLERVQFRYLA